jgi:hypothetical protein
MDNRVILKWQAREYEFKPKQASWYWTVGIIAGAIAVSAGILGDYLFTVIAIIGGLTLMLVGSMRPPLHTYSLTEQGFMIGRELIPYSKMTRFSIIEKEPRSISIESKTLTGVVTAPLVDADHRTLRMELKNRNIEEEEHLDRFVNQVARGMGL